MGFESPITTKQTLLLINNFNWMELRKLIRERIPAVWQEVLVEEKALTEYVELVYLCACGGVTNLPRREVSKELTSFRIQRIKQQLKERNLTGTSTSFWYSFDALKHTTIGDLQRWRNINEKIQHRKTLCR